MSTQAELKALGEEVALAGHAQYLSIKAHYRARNPKGDDDVESRCACIEDRMRDHENTTATVSLMGCMDSLRAAAEDAARNDAVSDDTALETSPGVMVHALLDGDGNAVGFVARRGEDAYATTFAVGAGGEGMQEAVRVARLGVPGEDEAEVLAELLEGNLRYNSHTAEVGLHDYGEFEGHRLMGLDGRMSMEWWPCYAEMIRPLALTLPVRTWPRGYRLGERRQAVDMVKADGGFRGTACAAWAETTAALVAEGAFRWAAPHVARTAEALFSKGYQWPDGILEYADHDRLAFAVRSPDGRTVGVWHRNYDLFSGRNEHMAVLSLGEDGTPERISVHPTWRAADVEPMFEDDDDEMDPRLLPSEDSTPMRPTRGGLARRIAEGEPLPPPACGMDLLSGKLLPEEAFHHESILDNMIYGVSENIGAAVCLEKGEVPGLVEEKTEFGEVGDVPSPGIRPR